jgi:hypothetical protein
VELSHAVPHDLLEQLAHQGQTAAYHLAPVLLYRLRAMLYAIFNQAPQWWHQALQQNPAAARRELLARAVGTLRLPPPSPRPPGFSDVQVRQYGRRQRARGYVPSQPNRQREFESELAAAASELDQEHDSRYRAARQQYLQGLLADPNQPRYVHGWIRHQLRRLALGQARQVRGVPGLDVGHMLGKHNQHDPANFRLEHASTNRARPGLVLSRLGRRVFNKYREAELLEAELNRAAEAMDRDPVN